MKKIAIIFLCFVSFVAFSQDKKITKLGKVTFEASVPSFEEVKAVNDNVTCIINTKTGEIASLALVKGFRFKLALMEEHFNENYVESSKYPKATFNGKIENFDYDSLTTTGKEYIINGILSLHGKSKQISTTAKIKKTATSVEIIANFTVNAEDFNIEIPNVVSNKLSKKVSVALLFSLK